MRRSWISTAFLTCVLGCSSAGDPGQAGPAPAASASASAVRAVGDGGSGTDGGTAMKSTEAADARLTAFAERFLGEYLAKNPTRATEVGEHRHDGLWPDLSAEGEVTERKLIAGWLAELATMPEAELGTPRKIDRQLLDNQLRYWLFALDELKDPERDPLLYTRLIGDGLDPLVTREFAPLEERMTSLRARLEGVPQIIAVAKKRLQRPATIYTETAIEQNAGLIALCEHDLAASFAKVPAQQAALAAAAKGAAAALHDFQTFLDQGPAPPQRRRSCASAAPASRRSCASSSTTTSLPTPSPPARAPSSTRLATRWSTPPASSGPS